MPPARTGGSTSRRKTQARRGSHAPRISPLLSLLESQLGALTFYQCLQLVEQFLVARADCLHEIGKVKRNILGPEEPLDTVHSRDALHFFRATTRRVAKRLSFENAPEESFSKQTIHRRHDGAIGLPDGTVLQHFSDGGRSSHPDRAVDSPFQRSKLGCGDTLEEGIKRIHVKRTWRTQKKNSKAGSSLKSMSYTRIHRASTIASRSS